MPVALRSFFSRHPVVREAVVWALPAIVVAAILRILFISYLPYAFWGADSRSYYSFAHRLITASQISLDEKRRFLYPILLLPVSLLPGTPLRWLAILQHAFGVATVLPLAYVVRKTMVQWRLWIVPVTLLFAGLPVVIWYEHELLGENVFFAALLWAFAGWTAWVNEARLERARRLFWWFFVPFALFILTKPSGRFAWPGVFVGLVIIAAWKRLSVAQIVALIVLMPVTLAVGSKKQSAWLLYTATFPLTQLETPLHAEYKAQIRDLVEPLAAHPDVYYLFDGVPFNFLERPGESPDRPLWAALANDEKLKARIYLDLAIEGIKAHPAQFVWFGVQRATASANLTSFGRGRFTGEHVRTKTEHFYAEAQREETSPIRLAFGLPKHGEIEPYAQFANRLDPAPGSWRERIVRGWTDLVGEALDFSSMPNLPKIERRITLARPTLLGCWLLAGVIISFFPRYRRTLGVWVLLIASYELGVFVVSQTNARYFGPAWPVIVVLLALPADALITALRGAAKR